MRSTTSGSFLFISHSHTTMTVQPLFSSSFWTQRSRATLASNLCLQYSELFLGAGRLHNGQRCQKQPLTNMATFLDGKAKSGLPGHFHCNRYPLMPLARNALLNVISGPVSFPLFPFIDLITCSFNGFRWSLYSSQLPILDTNLNVYKNIDRYPRMDRVNGFALEYNC